MLGMKWLRESDEHRAGRLARRDRHRQEHRQRMDAIGRRAADRRQRRQRATPPPPGSVVDARHKQYTAARWASRSAFLDAIMSLFGKG